jgi:hypothetical protein
VVEILVLCFILLEPNVQGYLRDVYQLDTLEWKLRSFSSTSLFSQRVCDDKSCILEADGGDPGTLTALGRESVQCLFSILMKPREK